MRRVLLVLPQSFNYNNNTGITLQSIFFDYDKSCIAEVVVTDQFLAEPLKFSFLFLPEKRKKISRFTLFRKIGSFLYLKKIFKNDALKKFIQDFDPEIIYCIGCDHLCTKTALYIKDRFKLPIIVHHYDNVRELNKENFSNNLMFDKLEKGMTCGLVISDAMKMQYENEFKHKYAVLMSSVEYKKLEVKNSRDKNIKFIYAGGLHLNRLESLSDIADSIKSINSKMGWNAHLDIYSPDYEKYKDTLNDNTIYIHNGVSREEIIGLYNEYDVLVHVEPFDESLFDFLKYSLSTKLPEYLISGRPILCYAPNDAAISRFIADNKLGYVATNKEELQSVINEMLCNTDQTRSYINNAYKMAVERFTHNASSERLMQAIEENIAGNQ